MWNSLSLGKNFVPYYLDTLENSFVEVLVYLEKGLYIGEFAVVALRIVDLQKLDQNYFDIGLEVDIDFVVDIDWETDFGFEDKVAH